MVDMFFNVYVFLFGICIGSFLNVCIYRMGLEKSVIFPASHCPKCQKPISWYDNIPLVSYLVLCGRCRNCKTQISFRYFLIEFLTGMAFVIVYKRFGLNPVGVSYIILICGLIVATFVDFDFRIIPDEISIGGAILGIILSVIFPVLHNTQSHIIGLKESVLGLLVGGGVIWLLGCFGDFIFKKESMGGGDVKLLAMIGAFLGWKLALLSLPIASLIGAVVGVIIKLRTKESAIAFGPYLAMGAVASMFWADKIIRYLFYCNY